MSRWSAVAARQAQMDEINVVVSGGDNAESTTPIQNVGRPNIWLGRPLGGQALACPSDRLQSMFHARVYARVHLDYCPSWISPRGSSSRLPFESP